MYLIKYVEGDVGCPRGSVYGELVGYNWNSNDYSDSRFPKPGTILKFVTEYEALDADFFYFGVEFICSENFLQLLQSFKYGCADFVEVSVIVKKGGQQVHLDKKYYLVRSREIRSLLDTDRSSFELRVDPRTNEVESDIYHPDRPIYDLISIFKEKKAHHDLDFFICSEMLMEEYVFSPKLKKAVESAKLKGFQFVDVEGIIYNAKLEF